MQPANYERHVDENWNQVRLSMRLLLKREKLSSFRMSSFRSGRREKVMESIKKEKKRKDISPCNCAYEVQSLHCGFELWFKDKYRNGKKGTTFYNLLLTYIIFCIIFILFPVFSLSMLFLLFRFSCLKVRF